MADGVAHGVLGDPPGRGSVSLTDLAVRLGLYTWVESWLFSILGGWVEAVPELDVKMLLGVQCHHHAWHADIWERETPQLGGAEPVVDTNPNAQLVAFFDLLSSPIGRNLSIEKLVGIFRVLMPRKVAAYSNHLENTSKVADAPTIRSLRLVLRDEIDDWREGELVLQTLLDTPRAVERAADHHRRLEEALVAAGGLAPPLEQLSHL